MIPIQLIAGIVFFLLGFRFIEEGIQAMIGRSFKLYLKKQTAHPLKAILGGTVVTAVLQSSSLVNFIILSFVGSGILKLKDALAIILGSNLGSTVTNWVIALVGFKVNLEILSLPLIALFGSIVVLYKKNNKVLYWSRFLFGMGLLFFGLEFIKTSISATIETYNLGFLNQYPVLVFVLFGFVATTLTQSSSVTVALALSALNANVLTLLAAMAMVLGSEVGTTVKLVIAAIGGLAVKKRLALGNLIYNLITLIIAFALIYPSEELIKMTLGIKNNLIALVFYQTLINLVAIFLFLPFLNKFGEWLNHYTFKESDETDFISKIKVHDGASAHQALEEEIRLFLFKVLYFSRKSFELEGLIPGDEIAQKIKAMDRETLYAHLKQLHGEIRNYAMTLQQVTHEQARLNRMEHLLEVIRDAMYIVKTIKDSFHDLDLLRNSSNDIKYNFYQQTRNSFGQLNTQIQFLLNGDGQSGLFEILKEEIFVLDKNYRASLAHFYRDGAELALSADEFSTLINFNREIYNASKYAVIMIKEYLLNAEEAVQFDEQLPPGI